MQRGKMPSIFQGDCQTAEMDIVELVREFTGGLNVGDINPRSLLVPHFFNLALHYCLLRLHDAAFLFCVQAGNNDGTNANKRSKPKANHFRVSPAALAFLFWCILLVAANKLLTYGVKRADYFMCIGGFVIFAIGGSYIPPSFFPEYSPIPRL